MTHPKPKHCITYFTIYHEAELRRLPKLFHLDDFEKCMIKKDGIFCLGEFEIYSDVENNPLYDLIKEKAQDIRLYNRSLLHRGYCLPTRCPSTEANATARFERCVDAWARGHALRTRLRKLHYCRAHGQPPPVPDTNSTPHRIFLYVVYFYLFMNALGTLYDVNTGKSKNKNNFLMMFSLRNNWSKLTAAQEEGPEYLRGLRVINGIKTHLLFGAVNAHVGVVLAQSWQQEPRFIEKFLGGTLGYMIGSMTTVTQTFILVSNFLTTYNLLLLSHKVKLSLLMIPSLFIRRIVRMLPLYLFVIGFSATWWAQMGDGPIWPLMVGAESEICRDKFWPHVFFLQNIFDSKRICNVQTWVMAVDIQLHIPALIMIILLSKRKEKAIGTLYKILAGATVLTTIVALTRQHIPALYYMTPEGFRQMFLDIRHLRQFFSMPISSLITMVVGVLLGFEYYNAHQGAKDEKKSEEKKLSKLMVVLHYITSFPVVYVWAYICSTMINIYNPIFRALMIPVERLVYALINSVFIFTSSKMRSIITDHLGWTGMRIIGRVSMGISMVHWCVNKTLAANRYTLIDTSNGMVLLDSIGVFVISFVLAIILTLMVEFPTTKMMDKLLSKL
ncbi:hypothetical protein ABMA28_008914 [Loxostege sticticalis]|uniref:Nose resistant to fluoxetine protein 6 n=1 Tax=Loxostege sticticalis TaxID=481309 RepID=A0ABD0SF52_LOXSC